MRTCVACRTRRAKRSLLRVVRRPDRTVVFDGTGSVEGRGAYVCADGACPEIAVKRGALARALRTPIADEMKTRLEHADVATGVASMPEAPAAIQGGVHGA